MAADDTAKAAVELPVPAPAPGLFQSTATDELLRLLRDDPEAKVVYTRDTFGVTVLEHNPPRWTDGSD